MSNVKHVFQVRAEKELFLKKQVLDCHMPFTCFPNLKSAGVPLFSLYRSCRFHVLLVFFFPKGSTRDWSHITNQIGMFCFTGLNTDQVRHFSKPTKSIKYLLSWEDFSKIALVSLLITLDKRALHFRSFLADLVHMFY